MTERERIGRGPWARLLATAVVPDEGSSTAERGRALAREGEVHSVEVTAGVLAGRVFGSDGEEHAATITADPVPPRVWGAVARSARGNRSMQAAVEGREQSVHLEHVMTVDWEQPLVPRTHALGRTCTCPAAGACEHRAALAYAVAAEIDRDPSLLLRWRGCVDAPVEPEPVPAPAVDWAATDDVWQAGPLPEPTPLRPLPVGAVLKRLGPSGLRAGGNDLADVLQRAYAAFAASGRR